MSVFARIEPHKFGINEMLLDSCSRGCRTLVLLWVLSLVFSAHIHPMIHDDICLRLMGCGARTWMNTKNEVTHSLYKILKHILRQN